MATPPKPLQGATNRKPSIKISGDSGTKIALVVLWAASLPSVSGIDKSCWRINKN